MIMMWVMVGGDNVWVMGTSSAQRYQSQREDSRPPSRWASHHTFEGTDAQADAPKAIHQRDDNNSLELSCTHLHASAFNPLESVTLMIVDHTQEAVRYPPTQECTT